LMIKLTLIISSQQLISNPQPETNINININRKSKTPSSITIMFKTLFNSLLVISIASQTPSATITTPTTIISTDTPNNGEGGPKCEVYALCVSTITLNWRDGLCREFEMQGKNATTIQQCSCYYLVELSVNSNLIV
jgi:hypothetical protein